MEKIIKGRYYEDDNFFTVFVDGDGIYTISRNSGDWSVINIGDRTWMGEIMTPEWYNRMKLGTSPKKIAKFRLK